MADTIRWQREQWTAGDIAWFEYHCWENHRSADADAWYHSHQQVTIVDEADHDGHWGTATERAEAGTPKVYTVRFADGLTWDVTEDELMDSPDGFTRPDPPQR